MALAAYAVPPMTKSQSPGYPGMPKEHHVPQKTNAIVRTNGKSPSIRPIAYAVKATPPVCSRCATWIIPLNTGIAAKHEPHPNVAPVKNNNCCIG